MFLTVCMHACMCIPHDFLSDFSDSYYCELLLCFLLFMHTEVFTVRTWFIYNRAQIAKYQSNLDVVRRKEVRKPPE